MKFKLKDFPVLTFLAVLSALDIAVAGPTPAVLAGSPAAADIASYLCNLTFVSTTATPDWIEGLEFDPFLANCTAAIVASSVDELVSLVRSDVACFGVGVPLSSGAESDGMDFVRPFYQAVNGDPIGIVVPKGKRETNLQLYSSIQAGLVSTLWAGNTSVAHQIEGSDLETLKFPTSAVTGFLTSNGNKLSYGLGPTPIAQGSLETPAESPGVNVTIAVYRGNTLPLANITGDSIDTWEGVEIELIKRLCAPLGPLNCQDTIVVDTVDERLAVLSDGRADISIGSIVINQDRLNDTSFVQPFYFSAGPALYVTDPGNYGKDTTLTVMSGQPVCTVTGSAQNAAGEAYNATLIAYDTRDEAVDAVVAGECIGLLWVSHVDFQGPTLIQVATDESLADPIGIAVSYDLPISAYSYISSISAEIMSKGPNSAILQWENTYKGSATKNEQLKGVVDAITNFLPSSSSLGLTSVAVGVAVAIIHAYTG